MEELEVVYEGEGEGQSLNWKFALSQIGVANKDNITGDDMFGGFAVHNWEIGTQIRVGVK